MEQKEECSRGFSFYFSLGESRGWKIGRDGPALRIQLGRLAIGIMLSDLEGMILWILDSSKKFNEAIGALEESKRRADALEAKIKDDGASYLAAQKNMDDLRLEAEAAGDKARQELRDKILEHEKALGVAAKKYAEELEAVRRQVADAIERNPELVEARLAIAVLKDQKEDLEMERADAEDAADEAKAKLEGAKSVIQDFQERMSLLAESLSKE